MSGARTAGGILGIIGGGLLLTFILLNFTYVGSWDPNEWIVFFVVLTIGVLALVGGIVTLSSDTSGGGVVLAGGIIAVTCGLIYYIIGLNFLAIYHLSLLRAFIPFIDFLFGIPLEGIIIFIGGILAVSSKEY